jgi:hypothetical protein
VTLFLGWVWSGNAAATITIYQDQAAWEAAAGVAGLSTALETFDGFADTFPDGNLPDFSVGSVNFADNDVGGTGSNGILGGEILSNFDLVFFRSNDVSGAQLRGIGFDHAVNSEPFAPLTVQVFSQGMSFSDSAVEDFNSTFIGILADAGELNSSIQFVAQPGRGGWSSFDNMRVAFVVPEPSTALLLAGGSLGLAVRGRRRRA